MIYIHTQRVFEGTVEDMTRKEFLQRIEELWPVAKGSVAEVRKPCIRPGCKACERGDKHRATILSFDQKGKRRCMYVPKEMESALRQAIQNGREVERLMDAMGAQLITEYREGKSKRGRRTRRG